MRKQRTSLSFSVRRHFIDEFFFAKRGFINKTSQIIDIGGKRDKKRGLFNIDSYGAKVIYVNLDPRSKPDIVADASNIPLADESCDIAIMGELLEHVAEPMEVLKEANRLLKKGGVLLATTPFMYPIHADPYDFGRYTENYWLEAALKTGFSKAEIEKQGTIFAVLALAMQHLFLAPTTSSIGIIFKKIIRRIFENPFLKILMWLDKKCKAESLQAWTTGYGLTFLK